MKLKRFALSFGFVMLAISTLWIYRVRAVSEAAEFLPEGRNPISIPAGTAMPAVIRTGIAANDRAGDTITAFIAKPVVLGGTTVIPAEAQIKGTVESLSISGTRAKAVVDWTALLIRGRAFKIETDRMVLNTTARTETDVLSAALKTLVAASMGVSIGAKSGDHKLITHGLIEAERTSVSAKFDIPISVVLNRALPL